MARFKFRKLPITGFSLIEVSLMLVVLSVLALAVMTKVTSGRDMDRKSRVAVDLATIQTAILNYTSKYGYYPCPAIPYLAITNQAFGTEDRDPVSNNCNIDGNLFSVTYNNLNSGPTGNAYSSVYAALSSPTSPDNVDAVMGMPPCKSLGLPDDCMFDPYGNRYGYKVVTGMARAKPAKACANYYDPDADSYLDPVNHLSLLSGYAPDIKSHMGFDDGKSVLYDNYQAYAYETDYQPEYALVYYGQQGYGAFPNNGGANITSMITPQAYDNSQGGYNAYQQVNYNFQLNSSNVASANFTPYLLAPLNPFSGASFDNLVVFGTSPYLTNTVCVACSYYNADSAGVAVTTQNNLSMQNGSEPDVVDDPDVISQCFNPLSSTCQTTNCGGGSSLNLFN